MKPSFKLTKSGQRYFKEILFHLEDVGLKDIDSLELTVLANNFALHEDAALTINDVGASQVTKTGYSQIRAEFTVYQKTWDMINKTCDKFGLNPAARDKIKLFHVEEEDSLSGLLG